MAGGRAQDRQARRDAPTGPVVGLGIVAASQPLAAQAGVQILERGGNAIDAAIAANATIGLMEPTDIGGDLQIESLVPETVRDELKARGHDIRVVGPRSGSFGYGQAVMSAPGGVLFGASEPRHDGAAIPQAPPIFETAGRR